MREDSVRLLIQTRNIEQHHTDDDQNTDDSPGKIDFAAMTWIE